MNTFDVASPPKDATQTSHPHATFDTLSDQMSDPLESSMAQDSLVQFSMQERSKANNTGLPTPLRDGLESLSGIDLSHVRVHTNSPEPAKVGAVAFTRGSEIHVGRGQEASLAHEGWHAVQALQQRVPATERSTEGPMNTSASLEHEADRMGSLAARTPASPEAKTTVLSTPNDVVQCRLPPMDRQWIEDNTDMAREIVRHAFRNLAPGDYPSNWQDANYGFSNVVAHLKGASAGEIWTMYTYADGILGDGHKFVEESPDGSQVTSLQGQAIMDRLPAIWKQVAKLRSDTGLLGDIFGVDDLSVPKRVLGQVYDGLVENFDDMTVPAKLLGNEKHNKWVSVGGMTREGSEQVDLPKAGIHELVKGDASGIATLIHEMTHSRAGTKDHAYGRGCQKLGPKKRIDNASTYEHAYLASIGKGEKWYRYEPDKAVTKAKTKKHGHKESKHTQLRRKQFGEVRNIIAKVWNNVDNAYLMAQETFDGKHDGDTPELKRSMKQLIAAAIAPHRLEMNAQNRPKILALLESRTKELDHVKGELKPIIKDLALQDLKDNGPEDLLGVILEDKLMLPSTDVAKVWVNTLADLDTYLA